MSKVLWQNKIHGLEYRVLECRDENGNHYYEIERYWKASWSWESISSGSGAAPYERAMVAAHLARLLAGGETVTEYGKGEEVDAPVLVLPSWWSKLFGRGE